MDVAKNIRELTASLPEKVNLVAVSKFHLASDILTAYQVGQRMFGESRVQELMDKREQLPSDIQWHFIGHLQSNKVKFIAPFVSLIHAIDSFKLLEDVNFHAKNHNRIIPVLLQIHIAEEQTKYGFSFEECVEMLATNNWRDLSNIQISGLMGMATFTDNVEQIRREFARLSSLFQQLKNSYFSSNNHFDTLSMGMSDDYKIAIEEGSTMIRIGSTIFGERV